MYTTGPAEACLEDANNILVAPSTLRDHDLIRDFFGSTITHKDLASGSHDLAHKNVYLCGDVSGINGRQLHAAARVFVIRELSHGYDDEPWAFVDPG